MTSTNKFRDMSMRELSTRLVATREIIENLEEVRDNLRCEDGDENFDSFVRVSDRIRETKYTVRAIVSEMKRQDEHHRYFMSKI